MPNSTVQTLDHYRSTNGRHNDFLEKKPIRVRHSKQGPILTSVSPQTALAITTLLALGYVADASSRPVNQAASTAREGGDQMPTQGNVQNSRSAPTDLGDLRRGQIPIQSEKDKPLPGSYAQVRLPRFMHPPYFMHPPVRKAPHHGHGTVIHVTHDGIKSAYRTFIKNKPSFPRSSFNETESVLHELERSTGLSRDKLLTRGKAQVTTLADVADLRGHYRAYKVEDISAFQKFLQFLERPNWWEYWKHFNPDTFYVNDKEIKPLDILSKSKQEYANNNVFKDEFFENCPIKFNGWTLIGASCQDFQDIAERPEIKNFFRRYDVEDYLKRQAAIQRALDEFQVDYQFRFGTGRHIWMSVVKEHIGEQPIIRSELDWHKFAQDFIGAFSAWRREGRPPEAFWVRLGIRLAEERGVALPVDASHTDIEKLIIDPLRDAFVGDFGPFPVPFDRDAALLKALRHSTGLTDEELQKPSSGGKEETSILARVKDFLQFDDDRSESNGAEPAVGIGGVMGFDTIVGRLRDDRIVAQLKDRSPILIDPREIERNAYQNYIRTVESHPWTLAKARDTLRIAGGELTEEKIGITAQAVRRQYFRTTQEAIEDRKHELRSNIPIVGAIYSHIVSILDLFWDGDWEKFSRANPLTAQVRELIGATGDLIAGRTDDGLRRMEGALLGVGDAFDTAFNKKDKTLAALKTANIALSLGVKGHISKARKFVPGHRGKAVKVSGPRPGAKPKGTGVPRSEPRRTVATSVVNDSADPAMKKIYHAAAADGELARYMNHPRGNCANSLPRLLKLLNENGFSDIKVRAMQFWENANVNRPSNHFLATAKKDGKAYAFDITAGQFEKFGIEKPLILTDDAWAARYQNGVSRTLIKYKDFDTIGEAQRQFGDFAKRADGIIDEDGIRWPTDYIEGAVVLAEPQWYRRVMEGDRGLQT